MADKPSLENRSINMATANRLFILRDRIDSLVSNFESETGCALPTFLYESTRSKPGPGEHYTSRQESKHSVVTFKLRAPLFGGQMFYPAIKPFQKLLHRFTGR